MTVHDDLEGCRAAHAALLAALADLSDEDVRGASALPGWTVGHVLTHLARNADAYRGVLEAALRGEVGSMYPSLARREADIHAGAGRSATELLDDLRAAVGALERAWADAPPTVWDHGRAQGPAGQLSLAETVWRRWREVCVHQADLDRGFDGAAMDARYLAADLPRLVANVTERLDLEGQRALAAWLLGRRDELGPVRLGPWVPSR